MKPTSLLRRFLLLAGSSMLVVYTASADILYWDSDGTTVGFGSANGTWGTSAFWSTDSTGATAPANTATTTSDLLYFGTDTIGYTGGRTVAINGTRDANSLYFGSASGAVTLSGGTALNLGGTTPTITVNSSKATISTKITGSAFTKTGSGTLIISNTTNDFSGNLIVNDGTLQIGTSHSSSWNQQTLPSTSNLDIQNGIVDTGYYSVRNLGSGANEIQITGGRSGISNSIQVDASGGYLWTVNNSAAYTVVWGAANEAGNVDATGFFNPSTFVLTETTAKTVVRWRNPLDLNATTRTIEVAGTGPGGGRGVYGTLQGAINTSSGTAGIIKTGAGTLMLDATNTYNGGTTINQGSVWFSTKVAMPTTGTVSVNDGTILSVGVGNSGGWTTGTSGVGTIGGLLAGDGGQTGTEGLVTYAGNVGVGFNINGTQTYSGDIANVTGSTSTAIQIGNKDSGTASDPYTFSGTLTLSGDNTYTGGTSINRGTLIAGSANALGTTGDITFKGGTLRYTASSGVNDYGSRIANSTAAIAIDTNSQDVTLSDLGSGNTGGLTKSGAGTLTLSGNHGYTGATTLSAGTLAIYDGSLSTGGAAVSLASNTSVSVLGGSGVNSTWNLGNQDLQQSGSSVTNVQMTIDGNGVEGSAAVTNVKILIWGRTLTDSALTITDGGQMNVNGEVRIGNPYYSTAGGANITIGGGTATSTFSGDGGDDFYIGYGERRGASDNTVTVSSGGVLTNIRDMFVGHVNNAQNNGAPPASGNQLTVTGTGNASMRGLSVGYAQVGFEANANVVEVSGGGSLSSTGIGYIGRANTSGSQSNSNTITVTGTGSSWNAGNQNVIVGFTNNASATSNDNVLTIGAGASVTNVNNLTVGSGTGTQTGNQLVVNGVLSATTVTVSTGNTLSGSGTVGGAVTINGALTPGNSPGVIDFTSSLELASTSTTTFEINGATRGTDYDGVDVGTTLTLGGNLVFEIGATLGSGTFDLFDFSSKSGDFAIVSLSGEMGSGSFNFDSTDVWSFVDGDNTWTFTQSTGDLNLTVIPEPGTTLLAALGALALLRRKR